MARQQRAAMDVTKRKRSDTTGSAKSTVTTQIKKVRQNGSSRGSDEDSDDSDARSALENLEGCVADAQDAWETDSLLEDALHQQTEDGTEPRGELFNLSL